MRNIIGTELRVEYLSLKEKSIYSYIYTSSIGDL